MFYLLGAPVLAQELKLFSKKFTLMTKRVPVKNTQIKSFFQDSGMMQVKCFKLIYCKSS